MIFEFPDLLPLVEITADIISDVMNEAFAEDLQGYIVDGIKQAIDETDSPVEFKEYIKVDVIIEGPAEFKVEVQIYHPAAEYFDQGVKPQPMNWLKGKVVVFTPKGESEPIIRYGNVGELNADGNPSWEHPGIEARDFIYLGIEIGIDNFLEEI